MEYTKNLNLKKPDVNEYYDIEKNNENMDLIDTAVGELNKKLEWKIYSSVSSLGLGYSATMDDILDSLLQRGKYTMLIVPIFKSDFPNLTLGGTGQRHMFTIKCVSGYVTIEDFDISNMTIHINAHNGNGYIGWKTL